MQAGELRARRPVPRARRHQRVDAESLPFEDASFDLIIANHLLEHVRAPRRLAEFDRCLLRAGCWIARPALFAQAAPHFRVDSAPEPGFANPYYGQDDHVRLFGGDIGALLNAAGLTGTLLPHDQLLAQFHPLEFGCTATSRSSRSACRGTRSRLTGGIFIRAVTLRGADVDEGLHIP